MVFVRNKRAKSLPSRKRRGEEGTFLVEMIVAVFLLAIALGMTVVIVGVLTKNVAATENTGTSADYAQSAVLTLSSYVRDAVSPTNAASAALTPASITACWGSSPITTTEGSTAYGWPSLGSETQLNETTGVIYAHDFDMAFCGYGSDSVAGSPTAPSVYEIFVNPVKSASSPGCTANNYCPVDIWDYGTSYQTSYYPQTWPHGLPTCNGASPCGSLVGSIGQAWCDQACQQFGVACSSIISAAANGISSLPTNYGTFCQAGQAWTPPLFNYYTSAGDPAGATSLNWVNAYTIGPSPPYINTTTNVTACQAGSAASCGPMDMYSPADEVTMQTIQDVVLNMTVLGQGNPSNPSAKPSSVQITDQILLRDLSQ